MNAFFFFFFFLQTILVSQNQVSSRLECYFKRPNEFIPERWIKGSAEYEKYHPYLVLPFGHGPRACIARRLAEQNIFILLARVRSFQYISIEFYLNKLIYFANITVDEKKSIRNA